MGGVMKPSEFSRLSQRIKAEPVAIARRVIVLPWPDKGLSQNARIHWGLRSKLAKAARRGAMLATVLAQYKPADFSDGGPVHVWITFFPPDRRRRDQDGMISSLKSPLDGIADALHIDDHRFCLHTMVSDDVGGRVEVVLTKGPDA